MFNLSLVFLIQCFSLLSVLQQNFTCNNTNAPFVRSLVARHFIKRWRLETPRFFKCKKTLIFTHLLEKNSLLEESLIDIQFDKFVVKLLNGEETVGHLPREYSRIAQYFLTHGGLIAVVEVSGHQRNGDSLLSDVWALSRQR